MELNVSDEEKQQESEKFQRQLERIEKEREQLKILTERIGENLAVKCGNKYCYIPKSGVLTTIGDIHHGNERLINIKAYDINGNFISIPLTDEIIKRMYDVYPEELL